MKQTKPVPRASHSSRVFLFLPFLTIIEFVIGMAFDWTLTSIIVGSIIAVIILVLTTVRGTIEKYAESIFPEIQEEIKKKFEEYNRAKEKDKGKIMRDAFLLEQFRQDLSNRDKRFYDVIIWAMVSIGLVIVSAYSYYGLNITNVFALALGVLAAMALFGSYYRFKAYWRMKETLIDYKERNTGTLTEIVINRYSELQISIA